MSKKTTMILGLAAATRHVANCRRCCLVAVVGLFILGCGSSQPLARLTCHVSHGDRALAGAEMRFELTGGKPATISGVSLDDGFCYIDLGERKGLPPGNYRISVTRHETLDGKPIPGGEEGQALKTNGKTRRVRYDFNQPLVEGQNELKLKIDDVQPIVEPNEHI